MGARVNARERPRGVIPEEIIEQAECALLDATDDLPDDAHVGVAAALEAALPLLREQWIRELRQVGWYGVELGTAGNFSTLDEGAIPGDVPVFVLREDTET
jgi:hypothetical protein